MKLYPINRGKTDNRYCGPAVLSFITGLNTSDCAKLIRQYTNIGAVRGTYDGDLRPVLEERGFLLRDVADYQIKSKNPKWRAPTLAQWLRTNKDKRTAGRVFLLAAGNHWQLITGRQYACGRIGDIVSIRDKRIKKRARVTEVYEVLKTRYAKQAPRTKGRIL